MKKNVVKIMIVALIGTITTACFGPSEPRDSFNESNLLGTWQEDGTEAFMRFLSATEEPMVDEYKFGYEWDEADDVHPEDLKHKGNGWFKWKLVQSDLTQIHLMDNGGADIPKIYTVKKLNSVDLELEDGYKKVHTYKKVEIKK